MQATKAKKDAKAGDEEAAAAAAVPVEDTETIRAG